MRPGRLVQLLKYVMCTGTFRIKADTGKYIATYTSTMFVSHYTDVHRSKLARLIYNTDCLKKASGPSIIVISRFSVRITRKGLAYKCNLLSNPRGAFQKRLEAA